MYKQFKLNSKSQLIYINKCCVLINNKKLEFSIQLNKTSYDANTSSNIPYEIIHLVGLELFECHQTILHH